jgi:hypothetical protein
MGGKAVEEESKGNCEKESSMGTIKMVTRAALGSANHWISNSLIGAGLNQMSIGSCSVSPFNLVS